MAGADRCRVALLCGWHFPGWSLAQAGNQEEEMEGFAAPCLTVSAWLWVKESLWASHRSAG